MIEHVRSHASDRTRKDHTKRQTQNKNRFGKRTTEIEAGNEAADKIAGETTWENTPIDLTKNQRKFIAAYKGELILDSVAKNLKEKRYTEAETSWKQRQPVRTRFLHNTVSTDSLPRRHEKFANLTCKILTGTIWTNKLKKRLKMQDSDICEICSEDGNEIVEGHEHVLGECPYTRTKYDQCWEEIKGIVIKNDMNPNIIGPWFSNNRYTHKEWNMDRSLGDKGCIPK